MPTLRHRFQPKRQQLPILIATYPARFHAGDDIKSNMKGKKIDPFVPKYDIMKIQNLQKDIKKS